jgi:hypothetical protein
MPVTTFKTRDEIPEDARDGALELKDGTFAVVVDDAKDVIAKIRKERDEFKKALREKESELTQLSEKLEAEALKGGDVDKKVAETLQKWQAKRDADIAAEVAKRTELEGKLRQVTLTDKARDAFVKAGGRAEKAEAALRLTGDRLDLVDGTIVVKDAEGNVTGLSLDDLFAKDFRKDMPEFYAGSKASGSGAQGTQRAGGGATGGIDIDAALKDPGLLFNAANAA